jgi:uncharacterized protein YecE (DUF72 family)
VIVRVRVGCCGFPKARGTYYKHFALVEVQRTFYKPPRLETAQRWRGEAPPDFEFTLKAWQFITHQPTSPTYRKARLAIPEEERGCYGAFRPTEQVFAAWKRTRQIAQALGARIVLFQCPASFTPTAEHVANLRAFFACIERGELICAWEPRGKWADEEIRALCRELDLIHCVDPFQRPPVYGVPAYFRLHGKTGYRYRYTDDDLAQLLAWCQNYEEVYCLFNNISMWESASEFHQLVEGNRTL